MSGEQPVEARLPAQRTMIYSLPAVVTMIAGIVLLVLALIRAPGQGWGAIIWLAAFIAMFAIRLPPSLRNRSNKIVAARKHGKEMLLLAAMFAGAMLLPLLQIATSVFDFANYQLPAWTVWVGAAMQLPFLWLFWRSHADLGRNWSVGLEVRGEHELITRGVYRFMRHPMYAAIWLSSLAQPLLIHNWLAGVFVVPAFAAMWFLRVPEEEAMMQREFGASWDEYIGRVGRLWPRQST